MTPARDTPVIAYCRVSTEEQGESRASLDHQEQALREYADARGWRVEVVREVASGKTLAKRPELMGALERLRAGDAKVLLVTKLDRLSRYAPDAILTADRALREGWHLAVLDMGGVEMDTTTSAGRAHLGMMAVFAQMFRDQISENTRNALAQKKAQGVKIGRPRALDQSKRPEEAERMRRALKAIRVMRREGLSYEAIANALNGDNMPGARGGRWHKASVLRTLRLYGENDNGRGGK
jgi:DNA invertase Pin-like site-specific DNA recombinase